MRKIIILDTTLRDGAQGENINFSLSDKVKAAGILADFGIDYIEAGWPVSNPKDNYFFRHIIRYLNIHSKIVAFCSTRKKGVSAKSDTNLMAVIRSKVKTATVFGKTPLSHVDRILKTTKEENLSMIFDSITFLKKNNIRVIYDAEHFFDGYKENPNYALVCLKTAAKAGAINITLCDTNGSALPCEIEAIIKIIKRKINIPLGIHAHNDNGLASANTITAIRNGVSLVQGTINGIGERCGNTDLTSVIPILQLKMGYQCVPKKSISRLFRLSREFYEITNENPNSRQPYVGDSAFAHKGGIHASAIQRCKQSYEHIDPDLVGNKTRVLISELAGKSNIIEKLKEWREKICNPTVKIMLVKIKNLENQGYSFEGADASFRLLYEKVIKRYQSKFKVINYQVIVNNKNSPLSIAKAYVEIKIQGRKYFETATGNGPVNALDKALRLAIIPFYPIVKKIKLVDYKVRIMNGKLGTAAKTRVLITSKNHCETWTTVGVSTNIIEASWQALINSLEYYLMKYDKNNAVAIKK